jgi:two-component system NtrC family sensor kinase
MFFRGIKNRVLLQFWILFFLSMLLIDILVLFIFLEQSISQYTEQKRILLRIACEKKMFSDAQSEINNPVAEQIILSGGDRFFFAMAPLKKQNSKGRSGSGRELFESVYHTLRSGKAETRKVGRTFGLFIFQHEFLIVTTSVKAEGRVIAAGGLQSSLTEIYRDYRRIQKIAFVFVIINSAFFALFGNHQLTRIYFKPLKRLAKRAETYQDEDNLLFSVRKEDNEFSVLSSSLNKMVHRIADDKRMLRETIGSLQDANKELTKAQSDVIRAEKLATVGRLTSGIAHEIGNPIGIVLGYLDLLKQTDLSEEDRTDFITRSEKEITRINHIIRQLLDMSRSVAGEAKPVSINQLLQELISVFSYQPVASHITFESSLTDADDFVFADPDQLRQVFLNILLNAVDAVNSDAPGEACIRLVTEPATDWPESSDQPEDRYLRITIQDTGPGIDPSHLPHVFDPFYTTKQPGKGTGLGLSVSFMIVEKLGGHISVDESSESGAAFHIILPLSTVESGSGTSR